MCPTCSLGTLPRHRLTVLQDADLVVVEFAFNDGPDLPFTHSKPGSEDPPFADLCPQPAFMPKEGELAEAGMPPCRSGFRPQAYCMGTWVQRLEMRCPLQVAGGHMSCFSAGHCSCRGLQPWWCCSTMLGASQTMGHSSEVQKTSSTCWHRWLGPLGCRSSIALHYNACMRVARACADATATAGAPPGPAVL